MTRLYAQVFCEECGDVHALDLDAKKSYTKGICDLCRIQKYQRGEITELERKDEE